MASNFEYHIDTEKLNQISGKLRQIKIDMDNKIEEINTAINRLESDMAYRSAESEQFKNTFKKFQISTQAEFDEDMEAFALFMEKVSTEHKQLAATISANISTQLESQTSNILSKFN